MALAATVRKVGDVSVVDLNGKITLGENTGLLRDEVRSLLSQGAGNSSSIWRTWVISIARVSVS
jgi:hypothetical protein